MPMSLRLIIVIGVVFFIQLIIQLDRNAYGSFMSLLGLNSEAPFFFWAWQLFTFQFLHSTGGMFLHVIINCAMLYVFGRQVESQIGEARFLKLYLGSGVAGGILQLLISTLFGSQMGSTLTVGASAGVFGLIAAFAMLNWESPVTFLLMFIFPVSMRAKYLLLIMGVLGVAGLLDRNSNVAHAAHLGGMLAGMAFIKYAVFSRIKVKWGRSSKKSSSKVVRMPGKTARFFSKAQGKTSPGPRSPKTTGGAPESYMESQVDPILDKISEKGIQSLTEEERQILEKAGKKIGRSSS